MKEHLATEHHFRDSCIYCGRKLAGKPWKAIHSRERLYSALKCDCGKKAMIRMPFYGSGHDSWNHHDTKEAETDKRTFLRDLESKIKILTKS